MNQQQSLIQKWLRQNTAPYPHKDRVYADIDATLAHFPTLNPKSDIYTHDDGRTQLLLCVHGLVPVLFRQVSYNIPIAIWITKDYPLQPPIVYVVPTSDMLVKAGKFVDVSGRINIEYVQQWERKSEGRHLSALVDAMQDQFSRDSPVYAKPKTTSDQQTPKLVPQGRAVIIPRVNDQRPSLPPKPSSVAQDQLIITPAARPNHTHTFANQPPLSSPSPPLNTSIAQSSALPPALPPSHHPSAIATPPLPPTVWTSENIVTSFAPTQPWPVPHTTHPPPPPPPPPPVLPIAPVQFPKSGPSREASLHVPRASLELITTPNLLDEDYIDLPTPQSPAPAPPRPANPELLQLQRQVQEKFAAEFASFSQAMGLDAGRLRAQQADLLAGEPAIRDEMARLEAVKDVCLSVAGRIRVSIDHAERNIAELRRKGDPEVDELVCSTSIVHNQLIELVAEDNAIEDTIYHLHRGLNAGRIDLERFLRTTRVLAEEQFMKRALIEKIQDGLPIGASIGSEWSFNV